MIYKLKPIKDPAIVKQIQDLGIAAQILIHKFGGITTKEEALNHLDHVNVYSKFTDMTEYAEHETSEKLLPDNPELLQFIDFDAYGDYLYKERNFFKLDDGTICEYIGIKKDN